MDPTQQPTAPGFGARVLGWLTGTSAASATQLGPERTITSDAVPDGPVPARVLAAEALPVPNPVDALRTRWAEESAASGWLAVSDWWDPACDAVVEALVARRDPSAAIFRLGVARADLGCGIEETIDDLVALWRIYIGGEPPAFLVRQVCSGWADAGLRPLGADTCIDPTTQLFTRAYLEARLGDLYRNGRGGLPADEYALVVVDIGAGARMSGLPVMGRVAEALRRVCTGGETLAVLALGRAVALCAHGSELPAQLSELDLLLSNGDLGRDLCAAIWVESLPRTFALVQGLLQDLAR